MTGRGLRILLTTLYCLLALATSASPEGAWVLWMHITSEVNGVAMDAEEWTRAKTAPTDTQCAERRDALATLSLAYLRGRYDGSDSLVSIEGSTVLLIWVDAKGQHLTRWRHECWPDTVDPRGPKGK